MGRGRGKVRGKGEATGPRCSMMKVDSKCKTVAHLKRAGKAVCREMDKRTSVCTACRYLVDGEAGVEGCFGFHARSRTHCSRRALLEESRKEKQRLTRRAKPYYQEELMELQELEGNGGCVAAKWSLRVPAKYFVDVLWVK